MIAVIFEVEPHDQGHAAYLSLAAALRAELETIDGFLSIERDEAPADSRRAHESA